MKKLNVTLIFVLVIVPTCFGIVKRPAEMGLSIAAIGIALAFANLDKFQKFKGAGFEAELRTAVDKTYAAIEELKELSLSLATPIIDNLAVSGQLLRYLHLEHKLESALKISEILKRLGASNCEIGKVCDTLYSRVQSDHCRSILHNLKENNKDKLAVFDDFGNWNFNEWNKDKIDQFITDHALERNSEANECIKDLEFFLTNHQIRRKEKWQG